MLEWATCPPVLLLDGGRHRLCSVKVQSLFYQIDSDPHFGLFSPCLFILVFMLHGFGACASL